MNGQQQPQQGFSGFGAQQQAQPQPQQGGANFAGAMQGFPQSQPQQPQLTPQQQYARDNPLEAAINNDMFNNMNSGAEPGMNKLANQQAAFAVPQQSEISNAAGALGQHKPQRAPAQSERLAKFAKSFNFLMVGDGTDKAMILDTCSAVAQGQAALGSANAPPPSNKFPMKAHEFSQNMRPYICSEGYGAGSRCTMHHEQKCCNGGGQECCLEGYTGNAAMHCEVPGANTHAALLHHFGVSDDAKPVFGDNIVHETQGWHLPFATSPRIDVGFMHYNNMLQATGAAQKPLVITLQSMLWDVYRFSLGAVDTNRCPSCERTPEAMYAAFEANFTRAAEHLRDQVRRSYQGPSCMVLRTQFAVHPASVGFGVPDWLPLMNKAIIRVGRQLGMPVFRYDQAMQALNRQGAKWSDIFSDVEAPDAKMLYHPAPATAAVLMDAFVEGIEKGLCDVPGTAQPGAQ